MSFHFFRQFSFFVSLLHRRGRSRPWICRITRYQGVFKALYLSPPRFQQKTRMLVLPYCKPFVTVARPPNAGFENSVSYNRDRRNAGNKTAPGMMVGVLLGVKFALGPKERSSKAQKRAPKLDLWSVHERYQSNRNVLAVSAYRTCKKEQALNALNNFRWQR